VPALRLPLNRHAKFLLAAGSAAVFACAAVLWLSRPDQQQPAASAARSEDRPDARLRSWPEEHDPTASRSAALDAGPEESPESPAPAAESALVPEEWEPPLFEILLDTEQGMDRRNARLIELATVSARGVPTVQQECLRHLVFGLSNNDGALFLDLTTNPVVPVTMRYEFLKEALGMRPVQLGEWLSRQLSNHHEPEINGLARRYLLDIAREN